MILFMYFLKVKFRSKLVYVYKYNFLMIIEYNFYLFLLIDFNMENNKKIKFNIYFI